MPTVRIDANSFIKGIKSDRIGINNSVLAPAGFYARSNGVDLHRVGYEGQPTTAQVFSAASVSNAAINSLPRAVAIDITASTPNVYYLLGGLAGTAPRIVEIINDAYDSTVQTIAAHAGDNFTTLPSTGFWGEDIILYKVGANFRVFYSWNDHDDGDVGIFTPGGGSPDDDFMSTVAAHADSGTTLNLAVPHRMVEGPDGKLYITNGRYVAQYDGANGSNGTINKTKYDLGVGWIAQDVRAYGNFLAIAAIKSGGNYINYSFASQCRVNLWNMTESGLGLVYEIEDSYISAIYVANNRLFAWTSLKSNTQKLWEFDGQKFVPRWETAVFTTLPYPQQIEVYKNLLCWVTSGGQILGMDLDTGGVHTPFFLNDGTTDATTAGFLKNTDQSKLFLGGLYSSTYKTSYLTANSTGFATGGKDIRTRIYPLGFKATIKRFRFFLSQLATSAQVQFSLFKNFTATGVGGGSDLLNLTLDNTTYGAITEYELERTIPSVSAFWLNMRLTGQVSVLAVEIDYDPL